jgi:hypothetical protein
MSTETMDRETTSAHGVATPRLKVRWGGADVTPSYPNVCNVMHTQEVVVLSFGLGYSAPEGEQEIRVQATDRVVMSRASAVRLALLLVRAAQETRSGMAPTQAA